MSTACDTSISLISLADAKLIVKDSTSTSNDGMLNDIINYVSKRFNSECGRLLKYTSYTEYYDGNGKSELYLNNFPIASTVMTITIDDNRAFTDTDDVVTSTDVMMSTESGRIRLDGDVFDLGERNVKIAYTAGYSTSDGPYDLFGAAREHVLMTWNRWTNKDQIGVRNEAYEGVSRTFETDLPWSVKQVLELYKDRRWQ